MTRKITCTRRFDIRNPPSERLSVRWVAPTADAGPNPERSEERSLAVKHVDKAGRCLRRTGNYGEKLAVLIAKAGRSGSSPFAESVLPLPNIDMPVAKPACARPEPYSTETDCGGFV